MTNGSEASQEGNTFETEGKMTVERESLNRMLGSFERMLKQYILVPNKFMYELLAYEAQSILNLAAERDRLQARVEAWDKCVRNIIGYTVSGRVRNDLLVLVVEQEKT